MRTAFRFGTRTSFTIWWRRCFISSFGPVARAHSRSLMRSASNSRVNGMISSLAHRPRGLRVTRPASRSRSCFALLVVARGGDDAIRHPPLTVMERVPRVLACIVLSVAACVSRSSTPAPGKRQLDTVVSLATDGVEEVSWDGRDEHGIRVPLGVYFIRATQADMTVTTKAVLLQ
jgi:hypothetical protein